MVFYSSLRRILKNTVYTSISSGFRFVSNAIFFVLIARAFDVEEFGIFTFALSFVGLFVAIVDYGLDLLVIREVSVSPSDALNILRRIINGKIILACIATLILFAVLKLFGYPRETEIMIYILWAATIIGSLGLTLNSLFMGLHKFQYATYPTVILNGMQVVLTIPLILMDFKLLSITLAYFLSRVVYFTVSFQLVKKYVGELYFVFNFRDGIVLLQKSLPFGVHAILGILYFQLDTVLLSYMSGSAEVGYYQAAMRLVLGSMLMYDAIVSAYFPAIAEAIKMDAPGFKKGGLALNKYMLLTGTILGTFLFVFSEFIVKLLYGIQYAPAVLILQILSVVVFLRFAGASYAVIITVANNQKFRAIGVALSLAVNMFLNITLIPRHGAVGAAMACLITHVVLDVIYIFFAIRLTKQAFIDTYCIRILLVGVASIIIGMKSGLSPQYGSIIMFFIAWLISTTQFIFNNEEKTYLKHVLSRLMFREA